MSQPGGGIGLSAPRLWPALLRPGRGRAAEIFGRGEFAVGLAEKLAQSDFAFARLDPHGAFRSAIDDLAFLIDDVDAVGPGQFYIVVCYSLERIGIERVVI